jgi:peptidoglycan/LPS O-acetylase OafA/YrhL
MNNQLHSQRFEQLDSIRGLAALTVVFSHINGFTEILVNTEYLKYTPLKLLVAGHEAVIIFFILSGFVLALPYYRGKVLYTGFLIKRFFRIYIPYLITMIVTFILAFYLGNTNVDNIKGWALGFWKDPITLDTITDHLTLLHNFDTIPFNTVIWSLTQELRISIIFPLLIFLIIRCNWKTVVLIAAVLSTVSGYFDTLNYISMFLFGAFLAKHRQMFTTFYRNLKKHYKIAFMFTGFLFYIYSQGIYYVINSEFKNVIIEWGIAIGACMLIIVSLGSNAVTNLLKKRSIVYIGKISFSMYLYHFPILLAAIHLLSGKINDVFIYIISVIVIFVISSMSYRWIEVPFMNIGRSLAKRWSSNTGNKKHLKSA